MSRKNVSRSISFALLSGTVIYVVQMARLEPLGPRPPDPYAEFLAVRGADGTQRWREALPVLLRPPVLDARYVAGLVDAEFAAAFDVQIDPPAAQAGAAQPERLTADEFAARLIELSHLGWRVELDPSGGPSIDRVAQLCATALMLARLRAQRGDHQSALELQLAALRILGNVPQQSAAVTARRAALEIRILKELLEPAARAVRDAAGSAAVLAIAETLPAPGDLWKEAVRAECAALRALLARISSREWLLPGVTLIAPAWGAEGYRVARVWQRSRLWNAFAPLYNSPQRVLEKIDKLERALIQILETPDASVALQAVANSRVFNALDGAWFDQFGHPYRWNLENALMRILQLESQRAVFMRAMRAAGEAHD